MKYLTYTEKSFYVEPTNACNISCRMCFKDKFDVKFLSFNDFKFILEKLNCDFVKLWGRGEPFLNKEIYDMLDYCKEKDVKTFITSNFSSIDFDRKDSLKKLDLLCVSLHSSNSEIYKKITGFDYFDQVLENIKRFKEINDCDMYCKSVVSSLNEKDIDKFKELCEDLKVKWIFTGIDFPENVSLDDLVELYPANTIYNRYKPYSLETKIKRENCIQPNWPNVYCDGEVYTCCKRGQHLGNIFSDEFELDKEVIKNAKRRKLDNCKNCTIC